jgi:hypothetical protein
MNQLKNLSAVMSLVLQSAWNHATRRARIGLVALIKDSGSSSEICSWANTSKKWIRIDLSDFEALSPLTSLCFRFSSSRNPIPSLVPTGML